MRRPRKAIDAAVFAASIRVYRTIEPDVRRFVVGNQTLCGLKRRRGRKRRQSFVVGIAIFDALGFGCVHVAVADHGLETVRDVGDGAATFAHHSDWYRDGLRGIVMTHGAYRGPGYCLFIQYQPPARYPALAIYVPKSRERGLDPGATSSTRTE